MFPVSDYKKDWAILLSLLLLVPVTIESLFIFVFAHLFLSLLDNTPHRHTPFEILHSGTT